MSKNSKVLAWVSVGLYAAVIFASSATTGDNVPDPFPGADKVFHVSEYLPFGFLVFRAFSRTLDRFRFRTLLISLFVIMLYALSDEFHQLFVPGREFSYRDAFCDVLGGFLGIILYNSKFFRWLK